VTTATAGYFVLRRSEIDLVALVQVALGQQQGVTAIHRLVLRNAPPTLVGAWDGDRLQQVLTNLLSNAVKYSPEGGEIFVDLELREAEGEVLVSVTDQGIGIPEPEQKRIFQRFYRLEAHTGRVDGLGLGLDVTRALVEAHGGQIDVRSTPGKGSTFSFTLPLTQVPSPDAPRSQPVTPQPVEAGAAVERPQVLVVDDDALIQQLLSGALEDEGYEVSVASDGVTAIEHLSNHRCDLMLLDMMMPRMNGRELVRELEERELREQLRIIVVSASHEARELARSVGADALVSKPFELNEVLETTRRLLRVGARPA
jgi:CheY-like chemotaxis protein